MAEDKEIFIEEKGNRKDDVAALNRAKEVRQLTADLMSYMEELRGTMEEITGGRDEATNQLIGKKDYDSPGLYHIVLNMNRFSLEQACELICEMTQV